jgi:hypothetical protein
MSAWRPGRRVRPFAAFHPSRRDLSINWSGLNARHWSAADVADRQASCVEAAFELILFVGEKVEQAGIPRPARCAVRRQCSHPTAVPALLRCCTEQDQHCADYKDTADAQDYQPHRYGRPRISGCGLNERRLGLKLHMGIRPAIPELRFQFFDHPGVPSANEIGGRQRVRRLRLGPCNQLRLRLRDQLRLCQQNRLRLSLDCLVLVSMLPNEVMPPPFGISNSTRCRIPTMISAVPIQVRGGIDTPRFGFGHTTACVSRMHRGDHNHDECDCSKHFQFPSIARSMSPSSLLIRSGVGFKIATLSQRLDGLHVGTMSICGHSRHANGIMFRSIWASERARITSTEHCPPSQR